MTPKEMIEKQILVQLTQAKAHIERADKLFDEWRSVGKNEQENRT